MIIRKYQSADIKLHRIQTQLNIPKNETQKHGLKILPCENVRGCKLFNHKKMGGCSYSSE